MELQPGGGTPHAQAVVLIALFLGLQLWMWGWLVYKLVRYEIFKAFTDGNETPD